MDTMTVLVTGANGFVGRHVVRALAGTSRFGVIATDLHDHFTSIYPRECIDRTVYIQGDITDRGFVGDLVRTHAPSCIVHLAGIISKAEDPTTHERIQSVNVDSTAYLLEAARNARARFVFMSTGLVYGDREGPFTEDMDPAPMDFYAFSKYIGERYVDFYGKRYGLPSVVFRASVLYGPGQWGSMFIPSICSTLLAGEPFAMTAGEQKRDLLYIEDFVELLLRSVTSDITGTFNAGSGVAVTMRQAAEAVRSAVGGKAEIRPGALPYRDNEVWNYCLDNAKARSAATWAPGVDTQEGIRRTVEYLRRIDETVVSDHLT